MSWATTTLSTLQTISRHEKEINLLAGETRRRAIYVAASSSLTGTVSSETAVNAKLTYHDETTATAEITDQAFTFPTDKYIIQIELMDAGDEVEATFNLAEGEGITLTDTAGTATITLNSNAYWTEAEYDQTWQAKLDLAKDILGHRIETKLIERGVYVDESAGETYLDTVTNADTFLLACDYLALSKIYLDLLSTGYNELFQQKYDLYTALYEQELADALTRMNLDINLDSTTDIYRAEVQGRLTR